MPDDTSCRPNGSRSRYPPMPPSGSARESPAGGLTTVQDWTGGLMASRARGLQPPSPDDGRWPWCRRQGHRVTVPRGRSVQAIMAVVAQRPWPRAPAPRGVVVLNSGYGLAEVHQLPQRRRGDDLWDRVAADALDGDLAGEAHVGAVEPRDLG